MAKRVSGFFFNQNISTAGAEMAKEDMLRIIIS
jgi:hypothetical protein